MLINSRELAKQEPRLVGDFVWAGMDYLGEVMVGSWEYADYAETFDGGLAGCRRFGAHRPDRQAAGRSPLYPRGVGS